MIVLDIKREIGFLKILEKILRKNVRNRVDKVCRYGGDEFVVILPYTS